MESKRREGKRNREPVNGLILAKTLSLHIQQEQHYLFIQRHLKAKKGGKEVALSILNKTYIYYLHLVVIQ